MPKGNTLVPRKRLVVRPRLVEGPRERGDGVADLEEAQRGVVAGFLVLRQRGVRAADHRAGQQLGVAEGVGDAVRGERVATSSAP